MICMKVCRCVDIFGGESNEKYSMQVERNRVNIIVLNYWLKLLLLMVSRSRTLQFRVLITCFLPSSIYTLGHMVLSCSAPSVPPSVLTPFICLSVRHALVTTLQPKIFNRSCSYLVQPLTLVGAITLSIMGPLCSFSKIQRTLDGFLGITRHRIHINLCI